LCWGLGRGGGFFEVFWFSQRRRVPTAPSFSRVTGFFFFFPRKGVPVSSKNFFPSGSATSFFFLAHDRTFPFSPLCAPGLLPPIFFSAGVKPVGFLGVGRALFFPLFSPGSGVELVSRENRFFFPGAARRCLFSLRRLTRALRLTRKYSLPPLFPSPPLVGCGSFSADFKEVILRSRSFYPNTIDYPFPWCSGGSFPPFFPVRGSYSGEGGHSDRTAFLPPFRCERPFLPHIFSRHAHLTCKPPLLSPSPSPADLSCPFRFFPPDVLVRLGCTCRRALPGRRLEFLWVLAPTAGSLVSPVFSSPFPQLCAFPSGTEDALFPMAAQQHFFPFLPERIFWGGWPFSFSLRRPDGMFFFSFLHGAGSPPGASLDFSFAPTPFLSDLFPFHPAAIVSMRRRSLDSKPVAGACFSVTQKLREVIPPE